MTNALHLYWYLFFPSYYQIMMPLSPSDLEKQEICMTVADEAMSVVKKPGLFPYHLMVLFFSL